MNILLSPQRNDNKINYMFSNEVITAEYKGVTDTFDLSIFPEGAEFQGMDTTLEIDVLVSVKRENGELYVTLLNSIGAYATQEESFPSWETSTVIQARLDKEKELEGVM